MTPVSTLTLAALVQVAVDATGATQGWIVALEGDQLRVVAAAGGQPGDLVGSVVPEGAGTCGFVVASGQPVALNAGAADHRLTDGVPAIVGLEPRTVLCVPCGTEQSVLGALELVDKAADQSFSFDDVELATLLGVIAGAALAEMESGPPVAAPADLAIELTRLAATDPTRYSAVATVIAALLASG